MSLTSRCMLNNYWEYSIQTKNSIKVPSSKEADRRFITFGNQHSTQGVHGNEWSGQIPKCFIQLVFGQTDLALTRKGAQLIVRVGSDSVSILPIHARGHSPPRRGAVDATSIKRCEPYLDGADGVLRPPNLH